MRLAVLLFTLVALQPAIWPAPVRAATSSSCAAYLDAIAKDLQTNTTLVDDLARPGSPSPDHIVQSAAGYNNYVDYFSLCPSSKKIYTEALLTTWKAWLDHATTHANPVETIELAARQLEKCSNTYHGTDDGATCATWEKQVSKWQEAWGSP